MLTIGGSPRQLCDGSTRREFLRLGAIGALGLSLPRMLQAAGNSRPFGGPGFGRAKRCLLLFLTGGPPHLDTFDLKPDVPAGIRGELRPIATTVPGIRFGELCPRLARQADKLCILRSVSHADTVHTSAGYTMLTGVPHPKANAPGGAALVRPTANDHPHLGALLARERPAPGGVPTFASLPEVIKDAAVNEFPGQGAGFLGHQYEPFRIEADTKQALFYPPDILLPSNMTADRLAERRRLLRQLDRAVRAAESQAGFANVDGFYQQAFDLIRSPAVYRAFQLDREPEPVRAAYGKHMFGQGCLLARRLLEAGISLVTVYWHYEGPDDSPVWDTHENNFPHLRNRLLPPADLAIAAVVEDLSTRGLLADTLVIVMGEFGRTPKINAKGGRDHWPHVQSVLLAGAGIPAGSTYGKSDRIGAYPAELSVTPADLAATILHLLGVRGDLELHDRTGKPGPACTGVAVRALVG